MCHHEHFNIHSIAVRPQFSPPINCEPTYGFFVPPLHEFCTTKIFNVYIIIPKKKLIIPLDVNVTKNINNWPHLFFFFFFDEVVPCLAHHIALRLKGSTHY